MSEKKDDDEKPDLIQQRIDARKKARKDRPNDIQIMDAKKRQGLRKESDKK